MNTARKQKKLGRKFPNSGQFLFTVIASSLVSGSIEGYLIQSIKVRRAELYKNTSTMMTPTIYSGDSVFVVKKFASSELGRGTLVAQEWIIAGLEPGQKTGRTTLRRIVGIPGDTVSVSEDGKIRVNGVSATYAPVKPDAENTFTESVGGKEYKVLLGANPFYTAREYQVPAGKYFTMGDNRPRAVDSRGGIFIPFDSIEGIPKFVAWSGLFYGAPLAINRMGLDLK